MSEIPEPLATAFTDRYTFERELGRGGMATVYLAKDGKHSRSVAVKVLRPEVAAVIGVDRFLREIEIIAQLQHPNVLTLIDSGKAGDYLYYVMPFVEGETLRGWLARSGTLPSAEAVRLTLEIAEALNYAHQHGVVHRDIKPENILLSGGHAVVADFGIAKAVSTAGGVNLTRTGFPLGTPGYMSPEQAAGLMDLDVRTDVFSLAAVTYEMVVGQTPGMWLSEEAVRLGHFQDAEPGHRAKLDLLPGGAEQTLARAMALRPNLRYATPLEFAQRFAGAFGERLRYSAPQVEAIVNRAAELEATEPTLTGAMTIGGVERLAAEVGIEPAVVRRAAREVLSPAPRASQWRSSATPPAAAKRPSVFLGGPALLVFERVVEGEVPESEYVPMVEEIRLAINNVGQVSTLGNSIAWRSTAAPGSGVGRDVHVLITPRGGQTRIRVEERLNGLAGGLFGGLMGGLGGGGFGVAMGVGMGALHSPLAAGLLAGGIVLGAYSLARGIFRSKARSRTEELFVLINRLAQHVADTAEIADPGTPRISKGGKR